MRSNQIDEAWSPNHQPYKRLKQELRIRAVEDFIRLLNESGVHKMGEEALNEEGKRKLAEARKHAKEFQNFLYG